MFCSEYWRPIGSELSPRSILQACLRCRYAREPEEESSEEEDDRQQQQGPKWGRLEILPGFVEIPTLQVGSSSTQVGQAGDTARLCGNTHSSGRLQQGPKWGRLEILPGFMEIPTLQGGSSRDLSGNTAGRQQEPNGGRQEILLSFENNHYCSHWLIKPLDEGIFVALKNLK